VKRFAVIAALLLSACGAQTVTPINLPGKPLLLSEWGAFSSDGKTLELGEGVTPYSLTNPLFTDYAHKLRTVWVPEGTAQYREGEVFDFPVGTFITKTFYYPTNGTDVLKMADMSPVDASSGLDLRQHRLIETRILTRREDGWQPISYVWNAKQTDAQLKRTGAVIPLSMKDHGEFAYLVPNENQCASCHADNATTKTIRPLGPRVEQLMQPYQSGGVQNQLAMWEQTGLVDDLPSGLTGWANWKDDTRPFNDRARAYLASNCAHCHNPVGPADTSGLDLSYEQTSDVALGKCKLPIAAGSGTGGRRFDIAPGAPEDSILVHRMETTDPGAMMPELGRALVHSEAVTLMENWIAQMEGDCES